MFVFGICGFKYSYLLFFEGLNSFFYFVYFVYLFRVLEGCKYVWVVKDFCGIVNGMYESRIGDMGDWLWILYLLLLLVWLVR